MHRRVAVALRRPGSDLARAQGGARAMSSWNFIKTLIRENMEDPAERDAKWEAHLRGTLRNAAST